MNKSAFSINNMPIPWSVWHMVVKLCNGNKEMAGRVFFRAAMSGAPNPIAWIIEGFKMPKRYAMKPCKQEEHGSSAARTWIEQNIISKSSKGMVSAK